MKKIRLTLFVTISLLLMAVFFIIGNNNTTLRQSESNFTLQDTSNVTKLFFADKQNRTVLLEKKSAGNWIVNKDFNAHPIQIQNMLKSLMDIRVKSPVAKAAYNNVVKILAARSVKVEIYQEVYRINLFEKVKLFKHEKLTKTYFVGHVTKDNLGTYMLMEGSDVPYIIYIPHFRGFVSSRYTTNEKDWRSHLVFNTKIDDIKSVTLEFPNKPESSYKIEALANENFKLTSLATNNALVGFDDLKVLNYLTRFKKLNYETEVSNMLNVDFRDSLINAGPEHILTLEKKSGEISQMKTFFKPIRSILEGEDGDQVDFEKMYALVNDDREFVLIQLYTFGAVLEPIGSFVK